MTLTLRLARIKRTRETKNQYAVAKSKLKKEINYQSNHFPHIIIKENI